MDDVEPWLRAEQILTVVVHRRNGLTYVSDQIWNSPSDAVLLEGHPGFKYGGSPGWYRPQWEQTLKACPDVQHFSPGEWMETPAAEAKWIEVKGHSRAEEERLKFLDTVAK